jgi:TonB family protein
MTTHLSDEQITGWLLDDADDAVALHLRECAACREETQNLRGALNTFRAQVVHEAGLGRNLGRWNMDSLDSSLGLLPEHKFNWRSLLTSYGLQILAVLFLINLGILMPGTLTLLKPSVAEVIQLMDMPKPQRPAVKPPPKLMPAAPPVETPQMEEPKLVAEVHIVRPVQKPKVTDQEDTKAPEIKAPEVNKALSDEPEKKVKIVHVGTMSSGSQATPTMKARPASQVQTGGFGDPFGIKGVGKPGGHGLVISQGGAGASFDLPVGPGYGNGSGGRKGARGVIPSSGFGNGIATGNSDHYSGGGGGGGKKAAVADTTFDKHVEEKKVVAAAPDRPTTTPVHIISKPKPSYTDEARDLKLEGEVLLEVTFLASGQCQVVRVVRGLGHGLDEAAQRAAQQIRFTPATSNGQPVDQTATIHVVFQLAD